MNELQKLMSDLYLQKDQKRGLEKTVLWLVSEVGELSEIIAKNGDLSNNSDLKSELSFELADCFAWLYSIANLLHIDAEDAFLQKYPNKCPRCLSLPCKCKEND